MNVLVDTNVFSEPLREHPHPVAATNHLVLATRNIRDFAPFQGLQLLDWFSEP